MSTTVCVSTRTVTVEISGQPTSTVEVSRAVGVAILVTGGRGPRGPAGDGGAGGGVSFDADPGPTVAPGSRVLWVRPFGGSYSLIVREG